MSHFQTACDEVKLKNFEQASMLGDKKDPFGFMSSYFQWMCIITTMTNASKSHKLHFALFSCHVRQRVTKI